MNKDETEVMERLIRERGELAARIKKMEEDKKHNGWSSYESWLVGLWLDNDEDTQRAASQVVRGALDPPKAIKEWVEDRVQLDEATLRSDLINAALCEVDWYEVAKHFSVEDEDEGDDE